MLLSAPFLLTLFCSSPPQEPPLHALHLRSGEAGPVLEAVPLAEGETQVYASEETLYMVLPPASAGTSGDLIDTAKHKALMARNQAGRLSVHSVGANGVARELGAATAAELAQYDMRVSVVGADGTGWSWFVRGCTEVRADESAPAIDMFRGMLPLAPGQFVITTEVTRRYNGPPVVGSTALELGGNHFYLPAKAPDGSVGRFICDTAAATTVVSKLMVPEGVPIEKATVVERSASGTRILDSELQGATGSVGGSLGQALLPLLELGDLRFEDCNVRVLEELPLVDGEVLLGVLGLDLMGRGPGIRLVPPTPEEAGRLELVGRFDAPTDGAWRVPLARASGLLFVPATLEGERTYFAIDSGSSRDFLDLRTAERLGLERDPEDVVSVRGLGGQAREARGLRTDKLLVGGHGSGSALLYVAEIHALASLAKSQSGGMLGVPFLSQFAQVEFDLHAGELRLLPR